MLKLIAIILIVSCIGVWMLLRNKSDQIRSDLVVPIDAVFLERGKIIQNMDRVLKGKNQIQTIAIVGMGGAGKTTLARYYGRSKTKAKIVFEINAETKSTLASSLRSLAYNLADTSDLKQELKYIQQIESQEIQEQQLMNFIQNGCKKRQEWLLIYDNVEDISQNYHLFPRNVEQWGNGTVIITTRDEHIVSNSYIESANIIKIDELDDEEKQALFAKILYGGRFGNLGQQEQKEAIDFLKEIPPFPLDVSVAAYYIKDTNISLEQYLERVHSASEEFYKAQESLLKKVGDYNRTRYGIVRTTIGRIIENNPKYIEPLLLIGLADSQNIPVEFFNGYDDKIELERFFYELKKYSIITPGDLGQYSDKFKTFSIHRSTQELLFAFLTKKLGINKTHKLSRQLWPSLRDYMISIHRKSDFFRMKVFIVHGGAILEHERFLDKHVAAELYHLVGKMHQLLGDYQKAFDFFERSVALYRSLNERKMEVFVSADLGYTYSVAGRHKEAIKILDSCVEYIKKYYNSDNANLAKVGMKLATAHKYAGNYEESIELFKQVIERYKQLGDEVNVTRASVHLGHTYTFAGNYHEARRLLENGADFFEKKKEWFAYAWVRRVIGCLYNYIGLYDKARDSSQYGLEYYEDLNGKKHIKITEMLETLSVTYLNMNNLPEAKNYNNRLVEINEQYRDRENNSNLQGEIYSAMGKYELAIDILGKKLIKYSQYYGEDHVRTAEVINSLGRAYFLKKDYEKAEELFNKALFMFQKHKHPSAFIVFENLAELYLDKCHSEAAKEKAQAAIFISAAGDYLVKALQIVESAFSEDSPHITRLQAKLKKIDKKYSEIDYWREDGASSKTIRYMAFTRYSY